MKPIQIIPLALKKMERREVPQEWVNETVRGPDQVVQGYAGRSVRQKRYKGQGKDVLLRVVVDEQPDRLLVITAYLTSQVARYWRANG